MFVIQFIYLSPAQLKALEVSVNCIHRLSVRIPFPLKLIFHLIHLSTKEILFKTSAAVIL